MMPMSINRPQRLSTTQMVSCRVEETRKTSDNNLRQLHSSSHPAAVKSQNDKGRCHRYLQFSRRRHSETLNQFKVEERVGVAGRKCAISSLIIQIEALVEPRIHHVGPKTAIIPPLSPLKLYKLKRLLF